MSKRKKIPNSVRFEVFKRDSFKCQYCEGGSDECVIESAEYGDTGDE